MTTAAFRRRTLLAAAGAAPLAAVAAAPRRSAESQRLHTMLDEQWEWALAAFPERATWLGDARHADRLTDRSAAAIAAHDAHARNWLARLAGVRRERLDPPDRLTLDLARHEAERDVAGQAHAGLRTMTLHPTWGVHGAFAGLMRVSPSDTERDLQALLARMAAYPRRIEQEIVLLQRGLDTGWVHASPLLERVLKQLDGQLAADPAKGPFIEPFQRPGGADVRRLRERWLPQALQAIEAHVLPAQQRLRRFLAETYLPRAPALGAMSDYPGGDAAYRHLVRLQTTTALAPDEIHAIGLREMARLRAEMDAVRRQTGFEGDFDAFVRFLRTDPRFFMASEQALLAGYRDILKRIEPELPRLFAELPRAPLGVRPYPPHVDEDAAASYTGPSLDGTRAGWFNAPVKGYRRKPTWEMETLVAHEGVPGHHLQSARAVELKDLPKFRRAASYVAYGEGWALYAEVLGADLGLYTDPYSRFGHLQFQAFRAARLVVDTGLHTKGWTREQALDWMTAQTGMDRQMLSFEVDRYLATPAQALGYMIGQLKIVELRDKARRALGDRFDIRRFHNTVLDQGPVPLDILERIVDEWIRTVSP